MDHYNYVFFLFQARRQLAVLAPHPLFWRVAISAGKVWWTGEGMEAAKRGPQRRLHPTNETINSSHYLGLGMCFVWLQLALLRVQGRLTDQCYRDEVLAAAVDPHLDTHPLRGPRGSPIFQQVNTPAPTTRVCRDFPRTNSVDIMLWPSRSPDLIIIENVWSYIGARVNEMDVAPNTADELWTAIQDAWNNLHQEVVRRLVRIGHRRCVAVIEAVGGPTKY